MTIAVVPVKDLDQAKGRLEGRLTRVERRELVLAMLEDVLSGLSQVPALSGYSGRHPRARGLRIGHEVWRRNRARIREPRLYRRGAPSDRSARLAWGTRHVGDPGRRPRPFAR